MSNLTRASHELFRRPPDECYESLSALSTYCGELKRRSVDHWHPPGHFGASAKDNIFNFIAGNDGSYLMNDWSFTQLCRIHGVAKDTVNQLTPTTAVQVLRETAPKGNKPFQILTDEKVVRSIHGTQYTRLWNADLVSVLQEFAVDFQPPQKGFNGATGLYAGEQDLFCFLIDPLGWTEIGGENFAPGFFVWNSEVGKRTLGITTFWFQAVCQNHIVWDATEVVEWTRKHTAKVGDGLSEIRKIIAGLVEKRDARKDGFAAVIRKAMETKLGDDAEEVLSVISKKGINRSLALKALELAREQGRFTVWSLVDALTRLSRESSYAGDRVESDTKVSALLQLV